MTYQAWFEVRCGIQTSIAGIVVDNKQIDGDTYARFLEEDLSKRGRIMTVKFLCVADHHTYQHASFDSLARTLDGLQ